jgi:hypothetical protein
LQYETYERLNGLKERQEEGKKTEINNKNGRKKIKVKLPWA